MSFKNVAETHDNTHESFVARCGSNGLPPWHDLKNQAEYWISNNVDRDSMQVGLAKCMNVLGNQFIRCYPLWTWYVYAEKSETMAKEGQTDILTKVDTRYYCENKGMPYERKEEFGMVTCMATWLRGAWLRGRQMTDSYQKLIESIKRDESWRVPFFFVTPCTKSAWSWEHVQSKYDC